MRRLFLVLLISLFATNVYAGQISPDYIVSSDDVTITLLNDWRDTWTDALNSVDGQNIQAGTVSSDMLTDNANPVKRWDESFTDYVFEGLLAPTTSSTLTSTTTLGTAYIEGIRIAKDATSHTYTANTHTYVDISKTGTYTYSEVALGAAEPSVAANSIRLFRISTDGSEVGEVNDVRNLAMNFAGTAGENFDRQDMYITVTTNDNISVWPGVIYHGSTRIAKTSIVSLDITAATDWTTGVSAQGTSTDAFVAVDSDGNIKVTTTAPTFADSSENTAGRKRYIDSNSENWRAIAWFWMNGTGSGNLEEHSWSNYKDGDVENTTSIFRSVITSTAMTTFVPMEFTYLRFYSSEGRQVRIEGKAKVSMSNAGGTTWATAAIYVDSALMEDSTSAAFKGSGASTDGDRETVSPVWQGQLSEGFHDIQIYWKTSGDIAYASDRSLIVTEL
jgi:hypothetical protein